MTLDDIFRYYDRGILSRHEVFANVVDLLSPESAPEVRAQFERRGWTGEFRTWIDAIREGAPMMASSGELRTPSSLAREAADAWHSADELQSFEAKIRLSIQTDTRTYDAGTWLRLLRPIEADWLHEAILAIVAGTHDYIQVSLLDLEPRRASQMDLRGWEELIEIAIGSETVPEQELPPDVELRVRESSVPGSMTSPRGQRVYL